MTWCRTILGHAHPLAVAPFVSYDVSHIIPGSGPTKGTVGGLLLRPLFL